MRRDIQPCTGASILFLLFLPVCTTATAACHRHRHWNEGAGTLSAPAWRALCCSNAVNLSVHSSSRARHEEFGAVARRCDARLGENLYDVEGPAMGVAVPCTRGSRPEGQYPVRPIIPCPAQFTHRRSLGISAFLKKTRANHISLLFFNKTASQGPPSTLRL